MYELKHISAGSLMRVLSVVFALLYLAFSISAFLTGRGDVDVASTAINALVGILLSAASGVVLGAVVAAVYNFTAKRWGGVHLDFWLVHEDERHTHEDAHGGGTVQVETKH